MFDLRKIAEDMKTVGHGIILGVVILVILGAFIVGCGMVVRGMM